MRWRLILLLCVALAASACGPAASGGSSPSRAATSTPAGTPALTKLTLGLSYIPDIQFAPFYLAKEKGYFRAEGLDVDFKQGFETDVLKLVGAGTLAYGVVSGDEVLVARSQAVPVVCVATWFQQYPVSIFAFAPTELRTAADLRGKTIGVPGRFGATYVGLRAYLRSAGLAESDVRLQEVGFNQVQALTQKQVDVAVGYTNNEPVQARQAGQAVSQLNVFESVQLASNGLVVNEQTLRERPDQVRAVVRAVLRGLADTIANPQEAVEITVSRYTPEAAGKRDLLRQILDTSIPLWQSDATARNGLGYSDPAVWAASRDLLRALGVLGADVDVAKSVTNDYLPPRR